jgi:hypothetical protein
LPRNKRKFQVRKAFSLVNLPKDHPVWRIISTTIVLFFITIWLLFTAKSFDFDEIRNLLVWACGISGIEAAVNIAAKKIGKNN